MYIFMYSVRYVCMLRVQIANGTYDRSKQVRFVIFTN